MSWCLWVFAKKEPAESAHDMPQVRGAPVVGFFLDHSNYANKSATSYTAEMQYLYRMQNLSFGSDGGLMPECGAAFTPEQRHYCAMSPHMVGFVRTPLFVFNSRCASPTPPRCDLVVSRSS